MTTTPQGDETPLAIPRRIAHRRARFLLGAALFLIGVWILWDFLGPLVWALVLAIATWPAYRWFVHGREDGVHGRVSAPLGFTLLIGLLLMVPLALVVVELGRELPMGARWLAEFEHHGMAPPPWIAEIPGVGSYLTDWWQANLVDPSTATELFGRIDRAVVVGWTRNIGGQIVHRAADLVVTLLALFFLYRGGDALVRELVAVTDRVFGKAGERLGLQMIQATKGTVNGLIFVGLGEGLVLGIAYAFLDLPHPVLLGALTGIVAAIPFGAPLIFMLGALVLFAQSGWVPAAILVCIGCAVIFVADHFIRPVLIGSATRLPFLWVLLGLFGGLESFGLIGVFIGPAVLSALMAIWRELAPERPGEQRHLH
jgi:predicted PurR-regulated permease PerM